MSTVHEIPLSNLIPSSRNVRRTNAAEGVEELAASIAAHGLLQNLTVRMVPLDTSKKKPRLDYEVVAGGKAAAAGTRATTTW